jgi:hypothetical protein
VTRERSRSHGTKSDAEWEEYQRNVVGRRQRIDTTGNLPFESESTDAPEPSPSRRGNTDAPFRPSPQLRDRGLRELGEKVVAGLIVAAITGTGWVLWDVSSRVGKIETRHETEDKHAAEQRESDLAARADSVSRAEVDGLKQKLGWIEQQLTSLATRFDSYLDNRLRQPAPAGDVTTPRKPPARSAK